MLLFLMNLNCLEYYIKDFNSDRYMSSEEKDNESPYFSLHAKPDLFNVSDNPSGERYNIIKALSAKNNVKNTHKNTVPHADSLNDLDDYIGSVLEVAELKDTLIYFPFYKGVNQYIGLVKTDIPEKFKMMHRGKCIGYDERRFVFHLVDCHDADEVAYFKLIQPQNYKNI